ncbi:hypothetical protein Msi02_53970 [Microbispora siamensis]|uniref:Uncharacterized protein n=1 Tax=Microbispora siamensis TaxID=564413 RepID=A0ABQ4GT18_9ACTN|nr:hypothetical protein Msi02_53970 [Microbispora siamensis]
MFDERAERPPPDGGDAECGVDREACFQHLRSRGDTDVTPASIERGHPGVKATVDNDNNGEHPGKPEETSP